MKPSPDSTTVMLKAWQVVVMGDESFWHFWEFHYGYIFGRRLKECCLLQGRSNRPHNDLEVMTGEISYMQLARSEKVNIYRLKATKTTGTLKVGPIGYSDVYWPPKNLTVHPRPQHLNQSNFIVLCFEETYWTLYMCYPWKKTHT